MYVMSKAGLCSLNFLCLLLSSQSTGDLDGLIGKANIYYQRPVLFGEPRELTLSQVETLPSTTPNIKVIVHGFVASRRHGSVKPLANAYLAQGYDNVYLADWEDAAGLDYRSSRLAVAKVALHFGKLLEEFFAKHNVSHDAVHVIGHSLGAHIAGGIGQYFKGRLARVTGLDPALPLFTSRSVDALHANAAQFVDVIHTDYPVFGDLTPRGTIDFYPSFGHTPQPGCDDVDLIAASKLIIESFSCSHNRAVLFYAESIGLPKNFPALPCSMNAIKKHNVEHCFPKNGDGIALTSRNESQVVYMGESVSRGASGHYYLETFDAAPFGMGAYTKF